VAWGGGVEVLGLGERHCLSEVARGLFFGMGMLPGALMLGV